MNICIVGAGVAGLTCASLLHEAGVSVRVLEAGESAGGRVRSAKDANGRHLGDLGPSWVWPPHQPRLATWLARLGVATMAQYESGDGCVERTAGESPVHMPLPGQQGQCRPVGGPQAIVDALLASLPAGAVRTGCPVVSIERRGDHSRIVLDDGEVIEATATVLAVPLRVASRDIAFEPPLPPSIARAWQNVPTWMAAQAKALVVYDTPFWRERGLSGRIASSLGPLVESHDHSGPEGAPAALVGFIGLDARARERIAHTHGGDALAEAVREQLVRCFGEAARAPRRLHIEDWARDARVATALDVERPGGHPSLLPPSVYEPLAEHALHVAVAEVARVSPGLLEGALVAGEQAARRVLVGRS